MKITRILSFISEKKQPTYANDKYHCHKYRLVPHFKHSKQTISAMLWVWFVSLLAPYARGFLFLSYYWWRIGFFLHSIFFFCLCHGFSLICFAMARCEASITKVPFALCWFVCRYAFVLYLTLRHGKLIYLVDWKAFHWNALNLVQEHFYHL